MQRKPRLSYGEFVGVRLSTPATLPIVAHLGAAAAAPILLGMGRRADRFATVGR
jgi:hypothetical protein